MNQHGLPFPRVLQIGKRTDRGRNKGAALKNDKRPVNIKGPFNVLWVAVIGFQSPSHTGKRQGLLITQGFFTAIIARQSEELSRLLKIPLTQDGFFLEAHVKLRPVDFAVDGIFLCGLAHYPKPVDESIAQAAAAAARAAIPLAKGKVEVEPIVSSVNADACFGCGICEYLCPYNAIRVSQTPEGKKAETIAASCKGCGLCASHCPKKAIIMGRFTNEQIEAQIHAMVGG